MISGDLSVFPLLPVLQLLLLSGKGGQLTLDHLRGGELWFAGGEILDARSGKLGSDDALQLFASLNEGTFTFEPDVEPPEQNLSLKLDQAMHRLMGESVAWEPVIATLPDWSAELKMTPLWNDHTAVTYAQFRALHLIRPGRPIRMLVELVGRSPLETAETYAHFVREGMLEIVEVVEV